VAANALAGTGLLPKGPPVVKTLSKRQYRGPLGEFMPWKVKVG
jgi:hypothetical protein